MNPPTCHPNRENNCKNLCKSCYRKKLYRNNEAFRTRVREKAKKWRMENLDHSKRMDKNKHLIRNFGISLVEYEDILKSQDGVCKICQKKDTTVVKGQKARDLAVDHCHRTRSIRGLLCFKCNTILAHIEKNDGILIKFGEYLKASMLT